MDYFLWKIKYKLRKLFRLPPKVKKISSYENEYESFEIWM